MRACFQQVGIKRAWLIGSGARGTLQPGSDLDIVIETDPSRPAGLLSLGGMQMDLTDLLGRTVHLTTLGGVPPALRQTLLDDARMLHAA